MKIQHLRIENILGIQHLELTPGGALTEIAGGNGIGKTSILEAIKAATRTGHDATLLRQGAAQGEIVLVMDDGTELHKRVTAERSTLDLLKDGKKVQKASDTIKGLTDLLSVNPVDFLTASKKNRVEVLLESMPIKVDIARLAEMSGLPLSSQESVAGLGLLDIVRQRVYDLRTDTNRAVREKDATINQLQVAMPEIPDVPEDLPDEDAARARQDELKATRDAELARIDKKLGDLKADTAAQVEKIKAEAQAKIDQIKVEADAAAQKLRDDLAMKQESAARARQRAINAHLEAAAPIDAALATLRAHRDTASKRRVTEDTIARMQSELEDLKQIVADQTAALQKIEAYKSELLDSLPIPGLEVRDGEVFRHGIPFDRLNTAQQVEIAIEIARLRAGDLAVCCVDRIECLSPETLAAFRERAQESGLQLFVTRVTSGDLSVDAL